MRTLWAVMLLAGVSSPADGQDRRLWSVAVYLGSSSSGAAGGLEAAMIANGYTEPFGGCSPFLGCVPESPSPSSYSHANPWLITARYDAREHMGVEMVLGQSAAGTTSGNRQGQALNVEYGGVVAAPLASLGTRRIRAGIGPAMLRSHWTYRNTSDGSSSQVATTSLGWLGSVTASLPVGSRLELRLTGQHRGFGSTTVRPAAPFPRATVRPTHTYVAGGVGLRFF